GGDIEFRCNFLTRQLNQAIATWWLTQNGLQLLPVISAVAELQLIYGPLLMVLPITLGQNTVATGCRSGSGGGARSGSSARRWTGCSCWSSRRGWRWCRRHCRSCGRAGRCSRSRCGSWRSGGCWRWRFTAQKPSARVHYQASPWTRVRVLEAQVSVNAYSRMPVVVLVSHRRRAVSPHCYWRRPRCQCHASPRIGAQVAHSLHQRIGRIGDVGGVVGGEEYIGRV